MHEWQGWKRWTINIRISFTSTMYQKYTHAHKNLDMVYACELNFTDIHFHIQSNNTQGWAFFFFFFTLQLFYVAFLSFYFQWRKKKKVKYSAWQFIWQFKYWRALRLSDNKNNLENNLSSLKSAQSVSLNAQIDNLKSTMIDERKNKKKRRKNTPGNLK